MKKIVIGTLIVVAVFACAWLVLIPIIGGLDLNFTNPSLAGEPTNPGNGNPGQTGGQMTWLNACTSEPEEQVTQLVETGQPVPNAWMFLDKNEAEVAAGNLWAIEVPTGVYGQVFIPATGLTLEVRGPGRIRVGAATFWCNDTGDQPHHGQMRVLDAKNLPEPVGDWVNINLP
ncbi:MAG: hypothetical protein BWY29_00641 [Microgenomates group bacterium ADurb.Bin238]|nr:MAG: hypothetical protein BWY29_00641 [Microgenomates group bacterium ADurb.Bin238]